MYGMFTFVDSSGNEVPLYDEKGNIINTWEVELPEQMLAAKFIQPDDCVLELGARFGSITRIINSILNNKSHHVAVEPDSRVWSALEKNMANVHCGAHLLEGFVSNRPLILTNLDVATNGYGATSEASDTTDIPWIPLTKLEELTELKFTALVADCEGYLETFFDENPEFVKGLRIVIFEADYPDRCNYEKVRQHLVDSGLHSVTEGFQNVYMR